LIRINRQNPACGSRRGRPGDRPTARRARRAPIGPARRRGAGGRARDGGRQRPHPRRPPRPPARPHRPPGHTPSRRPEPRRSRAPARRSVVSSESGRVPATSLRAGPARAAPNPVAMRVPRLVVARPRLAGAALLSVILLTGAYLWVRDSALVRVEKVTVVGAT